MNKNNGPEMNTITPSIYTQFIEYTFFKPQEWELERKYLLVNQAGLN